MSESSLRWSRRGVISRLGASGVGLVSAGALSACGKKKSAADRPSQAKDEIGPPEGSLDWAVAGDWRAADRPRDAWRHPLETLAFFGLKPEVTAVEFWPGKGWWTEILAPYLSHNRGRLYAATFQLGPNADPAQMMVVQAFKDRFKGNKRLYGDVKLSEFGPTSKPVTDPGTADLALFMETLHEWMAAGIVDKEIGRAHV